MSFPGLGNAHSRKNGLMEAYHSDSSSGGSEDDGTDPTVPDGTGEFRTWHRRKRRRTGQEARDDAALGVFGSDSEYEDSGPRGGGGRGGRPLRAHGMGFVKSGGGDISMSDGDDDDQNVEEEEEESGPDQEEQVKEYLGSFAGLRGRTGSDEDEEEESASGVGLGGKKAGLFKGFTKAGLGTGSGSADTSTGGGDIAHQAASGASTPGVDHRGLGSMESPLPSFESPLGRGFVSSIAHQRLHEPVPFSSPKVQEAPPLVAPKPSFTDFTQQSRGRGGQKKGGGPTPISNANPNSFAARMMAKMGYVPGQGLGTQGQGILAPIEVKLRPQGVGVGAIKEKTEQAKAEARRAAELRGEVLSDSDSEKERKTRKAKKKGAAAGAAHVSRKKEKPKFKTAEEIEKSAVGLRVPSVLKSIVDMRGPEARVLDPTSGLFTKAVPEAKKLSPEEEEKLKIARMARRDLESFAAEWQGLQDKKAYADQEEERLTKDVDEQTEQIQRLTALTELVRKLKSVSIDDDGSRLVRIEEETFKEMVEQLETLQFQFKDELEVYKLSEIAVAAIVPVFKQCMATWTPISDPFYLTELLRRLRLLLKVKSREDIEARYNKRGYLERPSKSATAYESLIYNLWLPKVRSAINNQWDVHDPSPVLTLLEAWGSLLPPFIYANVLDQLVMPKLKAAISDWNPRLEFSSSSSRKKASAPTPPPHIWIFPWLPHINAQTHLPSLLTDIKAKFTALLSSHPLTSGPIQGLPEWTELLGSSVIENLLIRHLLPRLALLLRTEFIVNPAEQDLSPLDALWRWQDGFRVSTLAHLLQAEMFPKWLNTLHMWLTSDGVVLGEVSAWYQFWQTVVPEAIRASPLVRSEFDKGLDMINHAMDLGPGSTRAKKELPLPEAGPARPIKPAHDKSRKEKEREQRERERGKEKARVAKANEQVSFRDAIEDWCAENNLLLIPLRKADEKTGQALFRITASASGVGGLVVYLRNDVVWGQDKKSRDKFEPLGLENVLERIGHM
ncbi:TFP11-domain-containing protein [Terfezia boudieri ATCC MYA-4762]|uniref:TFP11-domain-containing protein n=1 Tax=Terfezia boudieri ATCC MYA-4762 TaxID=1051890 RepID=A0A3N4LLL5_9PEZI|nr:TFP11-domain-containing protein [Terfezia boudieri ATCC MYA-4762]